MANRTRVASLRRTVLGITVLVLGLAAAPLATAANPGDPFTGSWASTDVDGSDQFVTISDGTAVRLEYTDFGAPSTCSGAPVSIFSSTLTGTVADSVLQAVIESARCGSKPLPALVGYPIDFFYQGSTDTLLGIGVTWHRVRAGS